tara:strand:- start:2191 stop:3381 length:1191 start_codon:yes stop_codon:yes gene_type:complete
MKKQRGFALVMSADFIVRAAYQMGKTPLLPIYAATLGAGDAFLGLIVSVSTITGMLIKPLTGFLSDQQGRKLWLLVGTLFFACVPFTYIFVDSPNQLFFIRILHGLATAIYGPVTLAYVADLSSQNQGERIGWFSIARNTGYVVGPILAGFMLLYMEPVAIFTAIGLISSLAFIPILFLPNTIVKKDYKQRLSIKHTFVAIQATMANRMIWITGGLATSGLIGIYATKTFLPIHALSLGINPAIVGIFFGVQESVHLILSPAGGKLGDAIGHLVITCIGITTISFSLILLASSGNSINLMIPALLIGVGQALFIPSNLAMASKGIDQRNVGLSLGFVGSFKNTGKVIGPLLAGFLIHLLDFTAAFQLIGLIMILTSMIMVLTQHTGLGISRARRIG